MKEKNQIYTTMRVSKKLNKKIKIIAAKDDVPADEILENVIILGLAELKKPRFLKEQFAMPSVEN